MSASIHGDLAARVVVDTRTLEWTPSPSGTVWRKRLHLVGPAESGQVTSLVRYEANSQFHVHDHPEGEEILVLEGVFSDEHGDWPAGSYLLNPEGFRHAPFSRDGCLLFVKLRQFPGKDRRHVAASTGTLPWQAVGGGRAVKPLYAQPGYPDTTRLEQWAPAAMPGSLEYPQGAELLVLSGSFGDECGDYGRYTWLRLPPGSRHRPRTSEGCSLYVKEGGFACLRSG
jgi:anti-sigma factor ChrR (cupin superfamily)